jgi:hypothetical protein
MPDNTEPTAPRIVTGELRPGTDSIERQSEVKLFDLGVTPRDEVPSHVPMDMLGGTFSQPIASAALDGQDSQSASSDSTDK